MGGIDMILIVEIGLLIYGIIVVIRGTCSIGKGRVITGANARKLGLVCIGPVPLSAVAGIILGLVNPEAVKAGELQGLIAGIEAFIVMVTVVALVVLSKIFYAQQQKTSTVDPA